MRKKCGSCKAIKDAEDFRKNRSLPDGLQIYCKECQRESNLRDYRNNKEELILQILSWQFDNFEKVRAYKRKYKQYEKEQRKIKNGGCSRIGRPPKRKEENQQSESQT